MKVIGVDPGSRVTGYGIVEFSSAGVSPAFYPLSPDEGASGDTSGTDAATGESRHETGERRAAFHSPLSPIRSLTALDHGCIKPPPKAPLSERYAIIFDALQSLIARFAPDHMAVEAPFYCKNVSSAFKLSQVRGVIVLAGSKAHVEVYEYSPRKVKQAVVGRGSAAKRQIQAMVSQILCLEEPPASEDAGDALAVAICHVHSLTGARSFGRRT